MGLEEPILHYYLKSFSIILVIIFLVFVSLFYFLINKELHFKKEVLFIEKGENFNNLILNNFYELSPIEITIFKLFYRINSIYSKKKIHYGHFNIKNTITFIELLNVISKPSNILNKITIVEGWSKKDLYIELSKYFDEFQIMEYDEIIADTYFFNKYEKFDKFYLKLTKHKEKYISNIKNNIFMDKYTIEELFIIGSLIEKEGLNYFDKKQISSVIINRLNDKIKLQIDATVIFALTNGNYNLGRKLSYSDLKVQHPYNTYVINGLPPGPIAYVGTKTIELILENYKTDFLFYFFNENYNKHIFSKNFKEHKRKLREYRNDK